MVHGLLVENGVVVNVALFKNAEDVFPNMKVDVSCKISVGATTTDGVSFTNTEKVTAQVPKSVRDNRQQAYIVELSEEGTFEKTVGDMLSAIVDHLGGNPEKLTALAAKIENVRTRYPKQGE